jgi:hypothetical protein
MRTILRIGVIAVAAGAVVIYLATTYALHHPESVLAQSTITGLQLTAGFHPVYHAGAAVGRAASRIAGGPSAAVQLTPEEEEQLLCVPPDPMPVEEAAPLEPPAISQAQRDFILQTIKEELQRHRQNRDDDTVPTGSPQTRLRPVSQVEPPIAKEEDDFPNTMPHCLDDAEMPDMMPGAVDSGSTKSNDPLFEFWLGLFESARDGEAPAEPARYYHDEEPPQCLEDPTYQYQYPGCPYTGKSPQEEKSGIPKMMKPAPDVKPMQKSPDDLPAGSKRRTIKGMTDPKKYELPARLRQNLPGDSTEAQEEPAHPDVDTTEFRPSDAHPGDFDPKPM